MKSSRFQDDYMAEVMERWELAREGWSEVRKAATEDMRAVNVKGGQWDKDIAKAREDAGRPALEFNELHLPVQRVVNMARKNRPSPRVSAGDDESTEQVAEYLEDRLRHIQYASQADVAYDQAVDGAASGGMGFYRIDCEYSDQATMRKGAKPTFNQEPRIRRILDPMTQYPDPSALEADFSDAKFWFDRFWMSREAFKKQFGKEPVPFERENSPDWSKEDQVCVARYWWVEERTRQYVRLADGNEGYADELGLAKGTEAENSRDVVERTVWCDLIDGEKRLKRTEWVGNWIPIIPVLGREVVVEGKRHLISMVRFALDGQKLKNACKSGISDALQSATLAPWVGYKGQFKDRRWNDAHRVKYAYLEVEAVTMPNGQLLPLPTRNTWEAPIQSLAQTAFSESDDIKRAVGYADGITAPSREAVSGIAVQRRTQQADLSNFHFEDNLVRSQWHCARVVLDLDCKLADTPRVMKARKEDGTTYSAPVTLEMDGVAPEVQGYEGKPHHRMDLGRYDVVIETGPTYETKREEESDFLTAILQAGPQMWPLYADLIFKFKGYHELEERAKLALPPPIQQALAASAEGVPPQVAAALNGLKMENGQLKQVLQAVAAKLQGKELENQGKLDVERLRQIGAMMLKQMDHAHESAGQQFGEATSAAQHMLDLFHESELAHMPPAPVQPVNGEAQ